MSAAQPAIPAPHPSTLQRPSDSVSDLNECVWAMTGMKNYNVAVVGHFWDESNSPRYLVAPAGFVPVPNSFLTTCRCVKFVEAWRARDKDTDDKLHFEMDENDYAGHIVKRSFTRLRWNVEGGKRFLKRKIMADIYHLPADYPLGSELSQSPPIIGFLNIGNVAKFEVSVTVAPEGQPVKMIFGLLLPMPTKPAGDLKDLVEKLQSEHELRGSSAQGWASLGRMCHPKERGEFKIGLDRIFQ